MTRQSGTIGIVVFPGSNCEQDVAYSCEQLGIATRYLWHGERDLGGCEALVLPGGFSYGDYLRCGAVARFSPVMEEVIRFAEAGRPVLGICNGFQILTEAHLLPGALIRNAGLKFICRNVALRVEASCDWLGLPQATVLHLPINHGEGNYYCDAATLEGLRDGTVGRVILRFCAEDGADLPEGSAPNGSLDAITGVSNAAGNVFGLMPHPDRAVDPRACHSTDGGAFFTTVLSSFSKVVS
ncbi:MAG: phosphoribosylformylglycinamidine synthase subunit PurQ [Coriobacteriia bacterium]|nr:phosphoribosylformylglycinamidine synthase subunit PurQ [Coriobacteriia bacterium]